MALLHSPAEDALRISFLRFTALFLTVISLFLSATLVRADEEKNDWVGGLSPNIDTGVGLVEIDVFVRNKDDQPRTGLTKDQFQIIQDGVNMPITSFSAFTQQSLLPPAPGTITDSVVDETTTNVEDSHPIYIVVYIDNANLRRMDRNRVLRALQKFAETIVAGPAQIMVVSHDETTEIVQPFTNDPRELIHAIRYVRTLGTSIEETDDDHDKVQAEIRRNIKNKNKSSAGREQVLSDLYEKVQVFAQEEENRLAGILQSLHETGTTLTGINGRKYFIYISNGLPLVVAKDLLHEFAALYNQASTISLTIPYNKKRYYDALAAAANAQAITFHAIDASGPFSGSASLGDSESPRSSSAATVAHENLQAPLRLLTKNTGGLAILNTDDFFEGFARIKTDLLTYYSMGYEVKTSGSDKVHLVDVKLDSDPGDEIRFRKAYVEKSIQSRVQERASSGLFFDLNENPMNVEVTTGDQKSATPNRWMKPVKISFPIRSIALVPNGDDYVGTAVVFVAARDFEGRRTDIQRRSHEVRIPMSDYEQRKDTRFNVDLNLLLELGLHNIVVGVLDENTRRASYKKVEAMIHVDADK